MRIITVSASYGAGGSLVAPLVADRLGLPYLNRAQAASDSQRMHQEATEAAHSDEELERGLWRRLLGALAATPTELSIPGEMAEHPDRATRREAERQLHSFMDEHEGGVVLGWAAALVFPDALRVRLDGPVEQRIVQGMAIEGLSEDEARRRQKNTDEVRRLYWRRLYQRDWMDPAHFHLWLDGTAFTSEAIAEAVAVAAPSYFDRLRT
ncbi:MAG: cytidylate kinase-like family protein [Acidimicrobiales bacterium]